MLRISSPALEGVYQGSKWLKIQLLCDVEELRDLFHLLEPFWIFPLTGFVDGKPIKKEAFLEVYRGWVKGLKEGKVPSDAELRRCLAAAFVRNLDALWLQEIPEKGYLTKIAKPVLQVQAHFFTYSSADGVFRPMSMGKESIFWGLQFSSPQIYQDPKTMELLEEKEEPLFPLLRLWLRRATRATPFVVGEKKTHSPIRLGKRCFSWIQNHPQLIAQNIGVSP